MWRKWNSCTLQVRMYYVTAAMENCMVVPQKKYRHAFWSSKSITGYKYKELKVVSQTVFVQQCYVHIIHNSRRGKKKNPRCPSTDEWIHQMWYIHIVEYYSSLKTKDILTHSIKNMDVKTLCQMKKARHKRMNFGWCHLYEVSRVVKFIETERKHRLAGTGGREEEGITVKWVQSFTMGWRKSSGVG